MATQPTGSSFANNSFLEEYESDVEEADVVLCACGEVGIPESECEQVVLSVVENMKN